MSDRHSLDEVTAIVRAVAAEYPDRVDARAGRGLDPRYIEHGEPCCLVAEVLFRLGWSVDQLQQLDGAGSCGVDACGSRSTRHWRWPVADVVNLADHRAPTVPAAPAPVVLDGCLCKTYGELFGDLAYQLERGEVDSVLHRLRGLARDYADEPLVDRCADDD